MLKYLLCLSCYMKKERNNANFTVEPREFFYN